MKWIKIINKNEKIPQESLVVTDGKSIAVKIESGYISFSRTIIGPNFKVKDSTHYMLFSDIELPKDNE